MADPKQMTVADVRAMLSGKKADAPKPADAPAPVEPVKKVDADVIVDAPPTDAQLQYNVDTNEPAVKPVAAKALKTDKKGG